MKLFRSDPAHWFAADGVIGLVLWALFAFAVVFALAVLMFSLEKVT